MLDLGASISEVSVNSLPTINMVELRDAHDSRHSGRSVSGVEEQGSSGEAIGQGIGSSKCGGRTSPPQVEEGAAHHSTSDSFKVAWKA